MGIEYFVNDAATTEIYTLYYTTLFRSDTMGQFHQVEIDYQRITVVEIVVGFVFSTPRIANTNAMLIRRVDRIVVSFEINIVRIPTGKPTNREVR